MLTVGGAARRMPALHAEMCAIFGGISESVPKNAHFSDPGPQLSGTPRVRGRVLPGLSLCRIQVPATTGRGSIVAGGAHGRIVLTELSRVLVPGGRILIGFFDGEPGEQFPHAIAPAHYWSAEALSALLDDAGFTVLEAERREREPGTAGSVRPHGAIVAARSG